MEIVFLIISSIYCTKYYWSFRLAGGRKEKYHTFNKNAQQAAGYIQTAAIQINDISKQNLVD